MSNPLLGVYPEWGCPWLCSPSGPTEPFGSPVLIAVDIVRVLVVLCALGVVVTSIVGSRRAPVLSPQAARFLGLSAFALSAASTELVHLGDYASYRLPLNMIGCGLCLWGNLHFLSETRHKPV